MPESGFKIGFWRWSVPELFTQPHDGEVARRGGRFFEHVWEWINTTGNHGLILSNLQNGGTTLATTVHTATDFDPNGSGYQTAKGCIVFAGQVPTPTDPNVINAANLHGRVIYAWGNIGLNKSKTVKVSYRRF